MIPIKRSNAKTTYEDIMDLDQELDNIVLELSFPIGFLGNSTRYSLATERRVLKNKINKLKESLYNERSSNY